MKTNTKFRLWSKTHNIFVDSAGYHLGLDGYLFSNTPDTESIDSDSYVLQQYTGMKDVNGVDIYEGDLVIDHIEDKSKLTPEILKRLLRQVIWVPPTFCLTDPNSRYDVKYSLHHSQFIEVIGNILEPMVEIK